MRKFNAIKNAVNFGKGKNTMNKFNTEKQTEETTEFQDSEVMNELNQQSDREIREKTKHRTFTSMAARRRWLALNEAIQKKKMEK